MALIFLIQWVSWTLIIMEMNNEINVTWTKPVTINAKEGNQAYWDLYLFFRPKLQPLS